MQLGDRMKSYEKSETGRVAMSGLPICIRVDGKSFRKWTRDLECPYDSRFSALMREVMIFLAIETNATVGYTQSDEISVVLHESDLKSQFFFGGKLFKLVSVIASMATAKFNSLAKEYVGIDELAFFDCRVWQVPNLTEATNVLLWRELDATRNSAQMAARHYFTHKECDNKNTSQLKEMLLQKDVNWDDYPDFFKRGTFVLRRKVSRVLTEEELSNIPEPYRSEVRGQEKEKTEFVVSSLPPLLEIINREGALFNGECVIV